MRLALLYLALVLQALLPPTNLRIVKEPSTVAQPTLGTITSDIRSEGFAESSNIDTAGVVIDEGANAFIVIVSCNNNAYPDLEPATIDPGGGDETDMGTALVTGWNDDDAYVRIYGIVNPPIGTFTVRTVNTKIIYATEDFAIHCIPLYGVDTGDPWGDTGTGLGNSTTPNCSCTSAVGDIVIGAAFMEDTPGGLNPIAPTIEIADEVTNDAGHSAYKNGASGAVQLDWTRGAGNEKWAAACISVQGAEAVGGPVLKRPLDNYLRHLLTR